MEGCSAKFGGVLFTPLMLGGMKEECGAALDMYYFGLLALWVSWRKHA